MVRSQFYLDLTDKCQPIGSLSRCWCEEESSTGGHAHTIGSVAPQDSSRHPSTPCAHPSNTPTSTDTGNPEGVAACLADTVGEGASLGGGHDQGDDHDTVEGDLEHHLDVQEGTVCVPC